MEIMVFLGVLSTMNLLIFAFVLLFKKRSSLAHKLLSAILVVFSGVHIDDVLIFTGIAWKYHFVNEIVHVLFFLLGPLYWMYTLCMVGKQIVVTKKNIFIHALPLLFGFLYVALINVKSPEEIKHIYDTMKTEPIELLLIVNFITGLQMGVYLLLSLRLLNRYNKSLYPNFRNILGLYWLRDLTLYLILLCYIIAPLLLLFAQTDSWPLYAFQPIMTTIIYFILYYKSVTFMNLEELNALKLQQQEVVKQSSYTELEQQIINIIELSSYESGKEKSENTDQISYHARKFKRALYELIYADKYP